MEGSSFGTEMMRKQSTGNKWCIRNVLAYVRNFHKGIARVFPNCAARNNFPLSSTFWFCLVCLISTGAPLVTELINCFSTRDITFMAGEVLNSRSLSRLRSSDFTLCSLADIYQPSDWPAASVFRVQITLALKEEISGFSETAVALTKFTRCHNPKNHSVNTDYFENLETCVKYCFRHHE